MDERGGIGLAGGQRCRQVGGLDFDLPHIAALQRHVQAELQANRLAHVHIARRSQAIRAKRAPFQGARRGDRTALFDPHASAFAHR